MLRANGRNVLTCVDSQSTWIADQKDGFQVLLGREAKALSPFALQSHIIAHTMRSISRRWFTVWLFLWAGLGMSTAAPKPHTVVLGQWQSVSIVPESGPAQRAKIRRFVGVDRFKEYTIGPPHD